ncbi:MAG: antibiotic biosynthesis monooxygenase [Erythrobacter sp.]|jgi:quinol monooxygenase YgiN|nr:antibiotic biosynthesis monooxygenase [Erythrobacter sp.]
MATLLAHMRVKPGKEVEWEALMRLLTLQTFRTEGGVIRYEFWKGEAERQYYCLLAFKDKLAYCEHQMSETFRGADFSGLLEELRVEYLGPVEGAGGGLPPTRNPPLPEDASEALREVEALFPMRIPEWWTGRL